MDRNSKACAECARLCCLIHREKHDSCASNSFFKIMVEDSFSQILFLPPKFAHSVPSMVGRSVNLEDSSGQVWEVTFQNIGGSLAFRQGWSTFVLDHDLRLGDLILFFPMRESSHFVVKIYDRTSCEKGFSDDGTEERRIRKRKIRQWDTTDNDYSSSDKFGFSASIGRGGMNEAIGGLREECFEDLSHMNGRDLGEKREEKRICILDLSVFETRCELESRIPQLEPCRVFQNDEWMVSDNEVAKGATSEPVVLSGVVGDDNNNNAGPQNGDKTECASDKGSSSLMAITPVENPGENGDTFPNAEISEGIDRISRSPELKDIDGIPGGLNINITENEDKTERTSSHLASMPVKNPRENGEALPRTEIDEGNDTISRSSERTISEGFNVGVPSAIPTENHQYDNQATPSHGSEQRTGKGLNGIPSSTCNKEKVVTEKFVPEKSMNANLDATGKIKTDLCNKDDTPNRHVFKTAIKTEIAKDKAVWGGLCPNDRNICGESSKAVKNEDRQSVGLIVQKPDTARPVVVKIETIDIDEEYAAAVNPIKFSPMLVTCNGQSYLELPNTLPFPVIKGRKRIPMRKTVYLRGPTEEVWPVLYHEVETTQFLDSGWEDLCRANRIKPEDRCLFTVESQSKGLYSLKIV